MQDYLVPTSIKDFNKFIVHALLFINTQVTITLEER